jgi:hypothetical protein
MPVIVHSLDLVDARRRRDSDGLHRGPNLVGVYPNQVDGTLIHCSNDPECLTGARLSRTGACDAPAKPGKAPMSVVT